MYTLYFLPDACSLATQVVLRELNQKFTLVNKQHVTNFHEINPVGSVPALLDAYDESQKPLTEGAAIMLYLLKKHENQLFPTNTLLQQQSIQDIMFANATMHPAYSQLFFVAQHIQDSNVKQQALNAAADNISQLWQVVESRLQNQPFLGGEKVSAADIMLATYSRWGGLFPVDILIGENTSMMLKNVLCSPNFVKAIEAEQAVAG
ncbi:glutathione S-transferase family protein [Thalassotalea fusca]